MVETTEALSTPFGSLAKRLRRIADDPQSPESLQARLNHILNGLEEDAAEENGQSSDDWGDHALPFALPSDLGGAR